MTDELRREVAYACRGLAEKGCGSGIGGHVSVRVPGEDAYLVNAFDRAFSEMTPADIVKVGFDDKVLDGDREVSLGVNFHSGIYGIRPDVHAIVHTHGANIVAQTAFNRPPRMWHNLCTYFLDDCVMSPDDDFASIAPAIGEASTILIPWHGAITVADTLGKAAALHDTLEFAARLDVTLDATSAEPMPAEMAKEVRALVERAGYLDQTWGLLRRLGRRSLGE